MTYREAIVLVSRMTSAELLTAKQSDNTTLAWVAQWPTTEPETWHGLLEDLSLVAYEAAPGHGRARKRADQREQVAKVWASRPWTYRQLAAYMDVHIATVELWKRTWFKDAPFLITTGGGRWQKTYQLMAQGVACPAA